MKKMLCKAAILVAAVLGVVSCENDLTPLGAIFLGEDPSGIIKRAEFDVKTYSVPVNPVQTNNFSSFPIGTYNDIYGLSTYSCVTQVNLAFPNPDVGNNAELLDVVLEIPYYSTVTGETISGNGEVETLYKIDSLYGNQSLQLDIFRSNYFLNSFNVNNPSERAVYYSNFKNTIENNLGELIYQDNNFIPISVEERIFEMVNGVSTDSILERLSPRLRKSLGVAGVQRWKEILFNLDSAGNIIDSRSELANNNLFQNYFRGLYFKVSNPDENGHLVHLNLNQAKIILTIQSDSDVVDVNDLDEDGDTTEFIPNPQSEITINFNGNRAVFIENEFNAAIVSDIATSNNPDFGAENIYLKGGPGSISVVELFGQATNNVDGEAPALTEVIANNWLINDAYIDFYVDQTKVDAGAKEPERILIYDYDTNRLLADYSLTQTAIAPINANLNHLGRLERVDSDDESSAGVKYRIRLTQHLSNILAGNTENTRLAIVPSQNVSLVGNGRVLNTVSPNPNLELLPISAAISHEGTILHGNLAQGASGEFIDKRPKLVVRYSETTDQN